MFDYQYLQLVACGNTIYVWLKAAALFFLMLAALKLARGIIIVRLEKYAEKTKTELDDMLINAIDAIYWPFYVFIAFYFALRFVAVPAIVARGTFYVFIAIVAYYAVKFLTKIIDFGVQAIMRKKADKGDAGIIKLLGVAAKITLWAGAGVMILANLGYDVTSLVAGLGIGGIAIALAVQNILGDLFNSLAIYFDKPFKCGDFIVVGDYMGTVKKIGIKSTRIQALQGEEIVVSNSDLTGARIQNFGAMKRRRIVFSVGVAYDTPTEKLKKIPDMIKNIIKSRPRTEVDRVHFKSFGDFSLIYEIVYYVQSGDYAAYMDIQQAINLEIIRQFGEAGIEIAFPTQTVYVKKSG